MAGDVFSTTNVPSHTNSAVDGYAIAATDLVKDTPRQFTVVGTTFAGQPYEESIQPGQCIRIMTGAKMPSGTDTVIMQEHGCLIQPSNISLSTTVPELVLLFHVHIY